MKIKKQYAKVTLTYCIIITDFACTIVLYIGAISFANLTILFLMILILTHSQLFFLTLNLAFLSYCVILPSQYVVIRV